MMDFEDRFSLWVAGVYVYGALALGGLIAAGITAGSKGTVVLAIASAGAAWVAQNSYANASPGGWWMSSVSAFCGLASAIVYLVGV